jgi:hypothetical protein
MGEKNSVVGKRRGHMVAGPNRLGALSTMALMVSCPHDSVHLRRLGYGDVPRIEMHLLNLDMASRNSRFGCGFGNWAVTAYVRSLDLARDILFGVT